jgi:ubiquinone/menaquinone biosynthesis C-methylase UbiE
MHRMISTVAVAFAVSISLAATAAPTPAAQRAARPANEWIAVLDAPERLAGMRIAEVVAALKLKAGDVVADLGAGSGPFVVPLATAVTATGRVYAVEIDRDFFPHIERKAREAGISHVQTVAGEASDPRLPAAVDVAFLHDVLHHIDNRQAYLQSLAKYLKPTSRIAIVDYHPAESPHASDPSLQVSKEQAAQWLLTIGFKQIEEVPLFKEKYFVIYGR